MFSPKRAIKTKTVEIITNIWYNVFVYTRYDQKKETVGTVSASTGHNPAAGAAIYIPTPAIPAFRAGKAFKDALKK